MRQVVLIVAGLMVLILYGCSGELDAPSQQPAQKTISTSTQTETKTSPTQHSAIEPDTFRLVMLGDSITAGYGLSAEEALPVKLQQALQADGHHIAIINAGVSGDTTADALNRFDWSVDENADGILIALGGNDLLQGVSPATTKGNLAAIINAARARDLTIILAGMKAPGNYGGEFQTAFDRLYPDLATEYEVAFYPFLLDGVAQSPALNQADGIHPNQKGVATLVEGIAPFIAETLSRQADN